MCSENTEKCLECLERMSNVTKESNSSTFFNALISSYTYYVLMLISDVLSHFVF
jgi:hypothetical protein